MSIDRYLRTIGRSWWPEEAVCEADVERVGASGPVDVMLSHDSPWYPPGAVSYTDSRDPGLAADLEDNRRRLLDIANHWRPRLLVHGHWHHRYATTVTHAHGDCDVVGLDCENVETSTLLLDATTGDVVRAR